MPPLPSRKSLEAMKRADLQKLCKDYGVRANLKSEALIDLLLDTQSQPSQSSYNTRRSVSTRQSSRAGPSRISSVIIHDTDDETGNQLSEEEHHRQPEVSNESVPSLPQSATPTRTRKAKELRTRLGVGRPVAAGGSGPRAVTKSLSVSRSTRGKPSRTLKQIEETIQEEPEDCPSNTSESAQIATNQSSESCIHIDLNNTTPDAGILQTQIEILKLELQKTQQLSTEVEYIRKQAASVADLQQTVDDLAAEVRQLCGKVSALSQIQAELKEMKDVWILPKTPPNPSTPKTETTALQPPPSPGGFRDSPGPSVAALTSAPNAYVANSPTTGSLPLARRTYSSGTAGVLGKRHRDSTEDTVSSAARNDDRNTGGEQEKLSIRPTKKRLKLTQGVDTSESRSHLMPDAAMAGGSHAVSSIPQLPGFKVFQGPEDLPDDHNDSRPPTVPLSEFFGAPSPSEDMLLEAVTSLQGGSKEEETYENKNQFNFSLLPPSSTPSSSLYLPSFPYPDPPQSPSPAGTGNLHSLPGQDGRTDPFKSFGLPSPIHRKPSANSGSQQQGYVNPTALSRSSSSETKDPLTSNDVGTGFGLTALSAGTTEHSGEDKRSDSNPVRRTMYGTELEGDTRFGDFGVKGVATGFWTGGRF